MTVRGRLREAVIILLLLVVAAIPRTMSLGSFLTADEKNWIGRSYEFVRAFKDWRFNDMLQTSHPGVTTLWLAGAAVAARIVTTGVPFTFEYLRHFVAAAQLPLALVNAVAVPVIYLLLRCLFSAARVRRPVPETVAALAALLIALDPWLIGYARVVHVDALLASLLFTAALSLMLYVSCGYDRRWLLVSAVLSGFALLTKAPAVFIVPFFWLAVASRERRALLDWSHFRDRSRDFVLWGLVAGLMFVLLWPAVLFVPNPEGNALVLKRDLGRAVATPHHMAESYRLDGAFYLKTLVTRFTPWTLALAAGGGIWLGLRFLRRLRQASGNGDEARDTYFLLVAYIAFFVLMMTLGAKKGDRYILPIAPAVDVLAALALWHGLSGGAAWVQRRGWRADLNVRAVFAAAAIILIAASGLTVYRYHPYTLAYSNPLLPDNLSQELGWGEGLEQVGAWLNATAPRATVAAWYPEELGAYTEARVLHINAHEQPSVRYVVLYRNMFGRAPDHPANDFIDEYYRKSVPVFAARVAGKEFAWVYAKEAYESVVGELVPDARVGQELTVPGGEMHGLAVLAANYNGRADTGELVVQVKRSLGGELVHEWRIPVAKLDDNQWVNVTLPDELRAERVFVEVFASGSRPGNAPTVRFTNTYDYRVSGMLLARDGQLKEANAKQGDLAVRVR